MDELTIPKEPWEPFKKRMHKKYNMQLMVALAAIGTVLFVSWETMVNEVREPVHLFPGKPRD